MYILGGKCYYQNIIANSIKESVNTILLLVADLTLVTTGNWTDVVWKNKYLILYINNTHKYIIMKYE